MGSAAHPPATGSEARAATLALLERRAADATVCPSEVARVLGGADWRDEMAAVHDAVDRLVADGLVRLSWKGVALARRDGPYRIAKCEHFPHGGNGFPPARE